MGMLALVPSCSSSKLAHVAYARPWAHEAAEQQSRRCLANLLAARGNGLFNESLAA